jgi:hypothetical protein
VARSGLPTQKNPAHSVTSDWAGFSVPRRTASKQRTRSATLAPLDIRPRIRAVGIFVSTVIWDRAMGMKEAETILRLWRELERELETADRDSREELQARITELRDRYQALVADIYDVEAAGGPAEGATGAA